MVSRRRRGGDGESGQALILVLLLLLVLSMVGGLVAAEIRLGLTAMDEQTARARLRALEDSAVAETLARLAAEDGAPVGVKTLDGGEYEVTTETVGRGRLRVRVEARYRRFASGVELVVVPMGGGLPPRVLDYRAVGSAPPLDDGR